MALTHFYSRVHSCLFKLFLVLLYEKHGNGLDGLSEDITRVLLGGIEKPIQETSLSEDIKEMLIQEDILECPSEEVEEELTLLLNQLTRKLREIPSDEKVIAIHLHHPNIVQIETVSRRVRHLRISHGKIHR